MTYLIPLSLLFLLPLLSSQNRLRIKRDTVLIDDDDFITSTSQPSFEVERLDTPMERIEIRLIDEQDNSTEVLSTPAVVKVPSEVIVIASNEKNIIQTTNEDHNKSSGSHENRVEYSEKYKKVEYVSDTNINKVAEVSTTPPEDNNITTVTDETENKMEQTSTTTTSTTTTTVAPVASGETEEHQMITRTTEINAKAWMTYSQRPTADFVDIGDLPPEIERDTSSDDEVETVEECIKNAKQLPSEVVDKLNSQAQRLGKLIRKLNKQQQQYCMEQHVGETMESIEYRQCPNWREEKMVHYYKLMRITYCADYNHWPNAKRIKRTYAQYLPLFETLYAFQKSE